MVSTPCNFNKPKDAMLPQQLPRRSFLFAAAAAAMLPTATAPALAEAPGFPASCLLGPQPGYSPYIGTMVSMLNWMQPSVTGPVRGLSVADLDWLLDKDANSIGALLLHLAATETYYQLNTFDGIEWGKWSKDIADKWDPAMGLGDEGRAKIKGHPLSFYLDTLAEVRAKTLAEFKKRDDKWFMTADNTWPWGPTNNFCKWFHVCEHESHHAGQIDLLLKRTPSAVAKAKTT